MKNKMNFHEVSIVTKSVLSVAFFSSFSLLLLLISTLCIARNFAILKTVVIIPVVLFCYLSFKKALVTISSFDEDETVSALVRLSSALLAAMIVVAVMNAFFLAL